MKYELRMLTKEIPGAMTRTQRSARRGIVAMRMKKLLKRRKRGRT